jgi:hypothetical protein
MGNGDYRNDVNRGKPKCSEKKLSQCHFVIHKSHVNWTGRVRTQSFGVSGGEQPAWTIPLVLCIAPTGIYCENHIFKHIHYIHTHTRTRTHTHIRYCLFAISWSTETGWFNQQELISFINQTEVLNLLSAVGVTPLMQGQCMLPPSTCHCATLYVRYLLQA